VPLRAAYGRVHAAAALPANTDGLSAAGVRARFDALLATMRAERDDLGALAPAIDHFLEVTASYQPGLFHCYDVPDLPRTNNDLEHFFGAARYHERRTTGRKQACPTTVVRGQVRLVASAATRQHHVCPDDLRPGDPAAYLTALEARLLKPALPS